MLLFCATLQDTEVSSFIFCSPVQKLVPHSLAILLSFATVSNFFCLNRAAFSGIVHIWKHLEDEALCGECFCLFVCCKCGKIGGIFWSPYKVQMDLIAGEWSEACMHTVRMKEKLIICSFVNERNTIPPYLLQLLRQWKVSFILIWKQVFSHRVLTDWKKEVVFNSLREVTNFKSLTFVLFNVSKWFFFACH